MCWTLNGLFKFPRFFSVHFSRTHKERAENTLERSYHLFCEAHMRVVDLDALCQDIPWQKLNMVVQSTVVPSHLPDIRVHWAIPMSSKKRRNCPHAIFHVTLDCVRAIKKHMASFSRPKYKYWRTGRIINPSFFASPFFGSRRSSCCGNEVFRSCGVCSWSGVDSSRRRSGGTSTSTSGRPTYLKAASGKTRFWLCEWRR